MCRAAGAKARLADAGAGPVGGQDRRRVLAETLINMEISLFTHLFQRLMGICYLTMRKSKVQDSRLHRVRTGGGNSQQPSLIEAGRGRMAQSHPTVLCLRGCGDVPWVVSRSGPESQCCRPHPRAPTRRSGRSNGILSNDSRIAHFFLPSGPNCSR